MTTHKVSEKCPSCGFNRFTVSDHLQNTKNCDACGCGVKILSSPISTPSKLREITLKSKFSYDYDGWKFEMTGSLVDTKALKSEEIVFIEKSAYDRAVEALKNISKFEFCNEETGRSGFTVEALNAQRTLREIGIES